MDAAPSGATYTVVASSGSQMSSGKLPAKVTLPRKNEYQIEIAMEGYRPATVALTKGVNGWLFGNLIFGWIVGFAVDFISGSAYKLEPAFVSVTLEEADQAIAVVQFFDRDGDFISEKRIELEPSGR
jgi:hypothetical protein